MTSPAKKADLARIRDNQKRSRARRKEYIQELEQRLRVYELQGIEASAEVQKSARKVLDENKQLTELLNRQGVTDAYIAHYLQASGISTLESSPEQMMRVGDAGVAAQLQQELMFPRQAAYLEQRIQFKEPSQSDDSMSNVSTAHLQVWGPSKSTIAYSHHSEQLGVCPSDRRHHSPSVLPTQPATTQSKPVQSISPWHMKSDSSHGPSSKRIDAHR